jgi:hypothetical protein
MAQTRREIERLLSVIDGANAVKSIGQMLGFHRNSRIHLPQFLPPMSSGGGAHHRHRLLRPSNVCIEPVFLIEISFVNFLRQNTHFASPAESAFQQ